MSLILTFNKHVLQFKFDAGTSRGVLRTKDSWIVKIHEEAEPNIYGLGEVSIIERLSHDYALDFEKEFHALANQLSSLEKPENQSQVYALLDQMALDEKPALKFALETALLDLMNGGVFKILDNGFHKGDKTIPINGLVWMGDVDFMQTQIKKKIADGFRCIKMKIGAIEFEKEYDILKSIRSKYSADELILRVDANGGFDTSEVIKRLDQLAELDIHSIEQPIMPRQHQSMQLLCKRTKLPIALDEELIGVFGEREQMELLEFIRPQYIILKPALEGGLRATRQWIEIAESMGIGWWITSALESNIGLNAICQLTAEYDTDMHQGLGTGQLYENNFHSPLTIQGESIIYHQNISWDHSSFDKL